MQRTCAAIAVAFALLLAAPRAGAQTPPPATGTGGGSDPKIWPQSPAQAADPPVLPPPRASAPSGPLSTSGTDLLPPGGQPASPSVVAGESGHADEARGRVRALEARVALDEARLRTLESDLGALRHLRFLGYVQLQYLVQSANAAASPNLVNGVLPPGITSNDVVARTDGTTTNTNMFRLRRTRLGATYETDVLRVFLQAELLPSGGPASTRDTIARNAEATGIAHWTKDIRTEFTGGLFQVPFRLELEELSLYRPFIERTWASLNLFPTERDLGLHAKTIAWNERLSIDVGILNGQRLGQPKFVVQPDLDSSKDFFATFGLGRLGPLELSASGYLGRSQVVDTTNLRVKNYTRYALNLGARLTHTLFPKLGETKLMGELLFGRNMDTGVTYAFAVPTIPASFTDDAKGFGERALYIRVEQELTRWAIAGFRFDTYTPDVSVQNDARDTYTFMAGARFSKQLRLINELGYAFENVHPKEAQAPAAHVLQYSAWLQGSFY